LRPLVLSRPSTRCRQENAGSQPRRIGVSEDLARTTESCHAEVSERVVAAFEDLAREREAGAVAADLLGGLEVVVAVRTAGMPSLLGGLYSAQRSAGGPWRERPGARCWSDCLTVMSTDESYRGVAQRFFGFVGGRASVPSALRAAT
jgi:hypothetical protein